MIGSTISHYRIVSKLGEGGMGTVYRAEDVNLGREVAIKTLPELLAGDSALLARFEREARVLASLNHPNIASVHDFLEVDARRLLVMEVVEGETLAERLERGPLPVDEAVRIALQVAQALEAAHERGVVHRDLKPANIKIAPDGRVKVLDFGLAKALSGGEGAAHSSAASIEHSPTLLKHSMTAAGVLLGTAPYMSPEQARGHEVDLRTDVWAFGCVLYEMLTGQRSFAGDTAADVLGAIVHRDPDFDRLPADLSPRLRRLVQRCLRRDVRRRLQAIGDARVVLEEYLEDPGDKASQPATAPTRRGAMPAWLPWATAAFGLALGVWGWLDARRGAGPGQEPVRRLEVRMGAKPFDVTIGAAMALSPDGRLLAYVAGSDDGNIELNLRPLAEDTSRVLARGLVAGDAPYHPFFSPDNQWIGFVTRSELKKVSVTGGATVHLADVSRSRGADWGEDGTIVYVPEPRSGLFLVSDSGGEPRRLTELEGDESNHHWPVWLPGGDAVLFSSTSEALSFENATIEAVEVESGQRKVLHRGGIYPRYVPTGHLLYVSESTLFARPFDPRRLEFTGPPMPVLENVDVNWAEGGAQYAVSPAGMIVYLLTRAQRPFTVVAVDRSGIADPLWAEPAYYANPQISVDGRRLSLSIMRNGDWDVWSYDLERGVSTRLTFEPGYDADQVLSPDGQWIVFASNRGGATRLFRQRSDGAGAAEPVEGLDATYEASPSGVYPTSWSRDGKRLLVQTTSNGGDVWIYSFDERRAEPFIGSTGFSEINPVFSPDGRWVAYDSDESGRAEVYVASVAAGGGKWQVSDGGAGQPRWSARGDELFFRTADGIQSVTIAVEGSSIVAGRPRPLFRGDFLGGPGGVQVPGYVFPDYDVFPSGDRFVMFTEPAGGVAEEAETMRLITGWFGELRALSGGGR
jgi:Tol biopolymer transport system component